MRLHYFSAIAIAGLLTTGTVACTSPSSDSGAQEQVDPCAGADPCAAAEPCAGADPCAAADPCAGVDPCAGADPCAGS